MHKFQYLFNIFITFIKKKKVFRTNKSSLAPYEVLHLKNLTVYLQCENHRTRKILDKRFIY